MIVEILKERGNKYGNFRSQAATSQSLKNELVKGLISSGKTLEDLPAYQWEAMEMICHKLARAVNGEPSYDDNFIDIAGFAQLVVNELQKPS